MQRSSCQRIPSMSDEIFSRLKDKFSGAPRMCVCVCVFACVSESSPKNERVDCVGGAQIGTSVPRVDAFGKRAV